MTPQLLFKETLIEIKLADEWPDELTEQPYQCPICHRIAVLDDFDCLGADEDCVFCNDCNNEVRLP